MYHVSGKYDQLPNTILQAYMDGKLRGLTDVCHVDYAFDHDIDTMLCSKYSNVGNGDTIVLIGQIDPKENGVYKVTDDSLQRMAVTDHWHGGIVSVGPRDQRFICLSPYGEDNDGANLLFFFPF